MIVWEVLAHFLLHEMVKEMIVMLAPFIQRGILKATSERPKTSKKSNYKLIPLKKKNVFLPVPCMAIFRVTTENNSLDSRKWKAFSFFCCLWACCLILLPWETWETLKKHWELKLCGGQTFINSVVIWISRIVFTCHMVNFPTWNWDFSALSRSQVLLN